MELIYVNDQLTKLNKQIQIIFLSLYMEFYTEKQNNEEVVIKKMGGIIKRMGKNLFFDDFHPDTSLKYLPVGVYDLKYIPETGQFYLSETEDFTLPSKIYGDHSIIKRWQKSWEENTSKNMGILLSGLKGSGKTITAQKFCIESKRPVIIIKEPFQGSNFVSFMQNPLLENSIIFIDEFEKVYDTNRDPKVQDGLLSLMDGMYQTRFTFLLTINEERISQYLVNRLGRIKYRKHYDNLDKDIISDVIDDLLINKEHKAGLISNINRLGIVTFDLVTNIIKEMNLFNENATDVMKHLNLQKERLYVTPYIILFGNKFEAPYCSYSDNKIVSINSYYLDTTIEKNKAKILESFKNTHNYTLFMEKLKEVRTKADIQDSDAQILSQLADNIYYYFFGNEFNLIENEQVYKENMIEFNNIEKVMNFHLGDICVFEIGLNFNIHLKIEPKTNTYHGNSF